MSGRVLLFCVALVGAATAIAADELSIPTARSMGAVGDGQADDTEAIQKAVDQKLGGVRFGKGVFRIARPIEINFDTVGFASVTSSGPTTILMDGPGPAFRFVGHHDGTAAPHTVKDRVWQNERTPIIEGLEIVGRHDDADGVELNGLMQPIISKLTVREVRHAVHLVNRNRNVIITACHLYDNSGAGVLFDRVNLHQFVMGDSHVSYNDEGGVVVRGGNVRNIHVGNCDLEGNMPDGDEPSVAANFLVDLTHAEGETATGRFVDTVAEMTITGCTIQHSAQNPTSANVRLIGRDDYPVNTVSITGNVMSDAMTNIDLHHVRGMTISANVFFNAPTDVRVRESQSLVLSGNQFDPRQYEARRPLEGGVVLSECSDVAMSGLQMSEITAERAAVSLTRCQRVVISGCQLRNCYAGFSLEKCSDCLLNGNMVSGTTQRESDLAITDSTNVQSSSNMLGLAGQARSE